VQGEQAPPEVARRGAGCAARAAEKSAAQMDGHPRQNPAYRPATEKALATGLFLWTRFAGDSSGSPGGGLTAVSLEQLGAVARLTLAGRAGYEPLRESDASTLRATELQPTAKDDSQAAVDPRGTTNAMRYGHSRAVRPRGRRLRQLPGCQAISE
jgi:hypothetical protein